jgi:hypothetical protein
MKRIRIPGVVDIVVSDDAGEIESLAQDPKLDRAYADSSIPLNAKILQRIRETLQLGGKPFPTVTPRGDPDRAAAQLALWNRLNLLAPAMSAGPVELESLARFVRGEGSDDACGPLVQEVVGRLFTPSFKASSASWNAAVLLNKAPRSVNPVLQALWAVTKEVDRAKQCLSDLVGGDLVAMHAVGIAVHNIVNGVNQMRQLYGDASNRSGMSPEAAGSRCVFAPSSVIRQPTAPTNSAQGELGTGTVVILNLQNANAKAANEDVAFLRGAWSQCPAEQWVPALLQGIWRRACKSPTQEIT